MQNFLQKNWYPRGYLPSLAESPTPGVVQEKTAASEVTGGLRCVVTGRGIAGAAYCLAQDCLMMESMIIPFCQLGECHGISVRRS